MINLDTDTLKAVRNILKVHVPDCQVLVFGSRVGMGRAGTYSDLDLALKSGNRLDWREVEKLKDAFAESDLPFSVDVVDFQSVSKEFQAIIDKTAEPIQGT